jgi:ribonuclease R
VQVAGFKLPKDLDRKAIQSLLASVKGKPESFTINLAVLKSLTRAEYSPKPIGHYALASEFYGHFTSPIRRYADLTIHRLLDRYFAARDKPEHAGGKKRKKKIILDDAPTFDQLIELGKHLGFTERRGDDAERELRQVKLLELLKNHIGEVFPGVVTGITNFGVFIQLQTYLIDGLIRYENLLDDWWEVDDKHGVVKGQRTGTKIGIGDQVKVMIARVDPARRELDLAITELLTKAGHPDPNVKAKPKTVVHKKKGKGKIEHRGGATKRNARSKRRGR